MNGRGPTAGCPGRSCCLHSKRPACSICPGTAAGGRPRHGDRSASPRPSACSPTWWWEEGQPQRWTKSIHPAKSHWMHFACSMGRGTKIFGRSWAKHLKRAHEHSAPSRSKLTIQISRLRDSNATRQRCLDVFNSLSPQCQSAEEKSCDQIFHTRWSSDLLTGWKLFRTELLSYLARRCLISKWFTWGSSRGGKLTKYWGSFFSSICTLVFLFLKPFFYVYSLRLCANICTFYYNGKTCSFKRYEIHFFYLF